MGEGGDLQIYRAIVKIMSKDSDFVGIVSGKMTESSILSFLQHLATGTNFKKIAIAGSKTKMTHLDSPLKQMGDHLGSHLKPFKGENQLLGSKSRSFNKCVCD